MIADKMNATQRNAFVKAVDAIERELGQGFIQANTMPKGLGRVFTEYAESTFGEIFPEAVGIGFDLNYNPSLFSKSVQNMIETVKKIALGEIE